MKSGHIDGDCNPPRPTLHKVRPFTLWILLYAATGLILSYRGMCIWRIVRREPFLPGRRLSTGMDNRVVRKDCVQEPGAFLNREPIR